MPGPHRDVVGAANVWRVGQRVVGRDNEASLSAELSAATCLHCRGSRRTS